MLQNKIFKYSRIAEDLLVDFLNNTLLRNGIGISDKNINDSLRLLGDSGKSLIRWGDGESIIMLRGDIYFQNYSPALRMRLMEIISNYNDNSNYYLCLPSKFLTCTTESLSRIKKGEVTFYQMHKGTRYLYKRFFKKRAIYLSHYLFKGNTQTQFDCILHLFSRFKAFVVVKSDPLIVQDFFRTFIDKSEFTIVTIPSKNAFESYPVILENIHSAVRDFHAREDEILVLLSAGPCAKVLAFDLSSKGVTTYDVGKFFECWQGDINCGQIL